jgi:hypothetical protein
MPSQRAKNSRTRITFFVNVVSLVVKDDEQPTPWPPDATTKETGSRPYSEPSASRIFVARSASVNGFWRNCVSGSSTP